MTNQQLCWSNPDARRYVCAIAADIAKHYDVDMIQTCSILFNPGKKELHPLLGVVLGGCFCPHCESRARKMGINFDSVGLRRAQRQRRN
jgi:hypothetical protein